MQSRGGRISGVYPIYTLNTTNGVIAFLQLNVEYIGAYQRVLTGNARLLLIFAGRKGLSVPTCHVQYSFLFGAYLLLFGYYSVSGNKIHALSILLVQLRLGIFSHGKQFKQTVNFSIF